MKQYRSIAILLLVVLPLGFAGIWRLQHSIDGEFGALQQEQDQVVLRSGKMMKLLSLEYAPLMADVYWTRAVQYYGGKRVRQDYNFESLWPLLDVTTTLDPNLIPAYRFGSTFLSELPPVGAGKPGRAVELIERGIHANPESWRLYQDLGNVYFFSLHDAAKATQAYNDGSRIPGAAQWMKVMAARIAERGDTRETSRLLWSEIYESTHDAAVRENAKMHLVLLKTDDDKEQLDLLLGEYAKKFGHSARNLRELVNAGMLPGIPGDPDGFAYVIGETGHAELNPESPIAKAETMYRRF